MIIWIIFGHFDHFWIIFDTFGYFSHFWLFWSVLVTLVILGHFWSVLVNFGHFWSFWSFWFIIISFGHYDNLDHFWSICSFLVISIIFGQFGYFSFCPTSQIRPFLSNFLNSIFRGFFLQFGVWFFVVQYNWIFEQKLGIFLKWKIEFKNQSSKSQYLWCLRICCTFQIVYLWNPKSQMG